MKLNPKYIIGVNLSHDSSVCLLKDGLVINATPLEKENLIPAVMHVDGTARVQTVTKTGNPGLYEVIEEFQKITGIPLVLNTSFNFKGRPIVETPLDAMKEFLESELDLLFIEPFLIEKKIRKGRISLKIV